MAVEKEPMSKHTLHLYEGDYERLRELYPELGAAIIIRRLIRKHIRDTAPVPQVQGVKELNL